MRLPGVALAGLETVINQLILDQYGDDQTPLDPLLNHRTVCIDLTGMALQLYLRFSRATVTVLGETDHPADATIRGTPIALAAANLRGETHTRDIQLEGDLQIAQAVERLFGRLNFDWEEHLSRVAGDAVAHQTGNILHRLHKWGKTSLNRLADDTRDYLHYESRQLPLPDEVDAFNREVDEVRAAVERLEMRVQRLQQRANRENS